NNCEVFLNIIFQKPALKRVGFFMPSIACRLTGDKKIFCHCWSPDRQYQRLKNSNYFGQATKTGE
ncbi:MAG: hypothetical protein WAU24_14090, partial [Chitinophagaceae bacterium]